MEHFRFQDSNDDLGQDSVNLLGPGEKNIDEEIVNDVPLNARSDQNSNNVQELLTTTMSSSGDHLMDDRSFVSTVGVNTPHSGGRPTIYLIAAALMAALGGGLFGYDLGVISGALLQLKEEFSLSCFQQELVVSSLLFGATIGSLLGGFLLDKIGRRWSIIINSLIFISGALVLTCAMSYPVLILGRLIVGFAVSLSAIGECVYISEISPKERRGQLVSLNELGITLGLMLAYLINFCFIKITAGWRYMFALSAIPALFQGIGMYLLPTSPRFLVKLKNINQAEKVLKKLRGSDQVAEELSAIQDSVSLERSYSLLHLFQSVDNMRWRMGIGTMLVFFQQITGQTNVVYYAPTIMENLGFEDDVSASIASLGVGLVKVTATCLCLMLVDKFGRRCFLLCGASLMSLFIIVLGIITLAVPTPVITDTCQTTSHSVYNASLNSTALVRHKRSKGLLYGPEVSSQYKHNAVYSKDHLYSHSYAYDSMKESAIERGEGPNIAFMPTLEHERTSPLAFVSGRVIRQSKTKTSRTERAHTTRSPRDDLVSSEIKRPNIHSAFHQSINLKSSINIAQDGIANNVSADQVLVHSAMSEEAQARSEVHIHVPISAKWSALVLLFLYVGAYSFGFGPVSWLVISEIFPAGLRGRASSLTTVFNWGTNVIISLTFLDVIRKFGVSWTFLIYGIVCALSAVFIYFTIPETKNRSLEQISEELSIRSGVGEHCSFKCLWCSCCCVRSSRRYRPALLLTDDTTL